MKNIKKLTLLHSNDLHGDFLPEAKNGEHVGGVSLLSGYVKGVRESEKNVIYAIAGDMFRGSVIDEEYRGISTVEIINMLSPDIVTVGNHELDYGIAHLLFIERCAEFPIINANLRIKPKGKRLFRPARVITVDGMRILFIGVITEEAMAQTKQDSLIGPFIGVSDAAAEIGAICGEYTDTDIDLTVLLTHIGIEADKKLAASLDPAWGVDLIIGGHSHTFMEAPIVENGIVIAHAGTGTDIIGRFDVEIDTDKNALSSFTWQSVSVSDTTSERDRALEATVKKYKEATDKKYERIITRFESTLTHPKRGEESELGNLFADVFRESLDLDVMILGSGSIRSDVLGPVVEYGGLTEAFPFDDGVYRFRITGEMFRRMMKFMLREEKFTGRAEFYQLSHGMKLVYSRSLGDLTEFSYNGEPIKDTDEFTVGMQTYHFTNIEAFLGVTHEEVAALCRPRVVAVSCIDVLEDYLSCHTEIEPSALGRIIIND